jgi:nucleoside-diphosphate-sugar epimerase
MKLIVMGAGYVGIALLKYFQSQQSLHELCITTTQLKRVSELKPYGSQVLYLDPSDDTLFKEAIEWADGIVIAIAPKNSQNYKETYLATARHVSKILKDKTRPFYLLSISSTSVYSGIDSEWAFEDQVLDPKTENAQILFETENLYLNSGVSGCILRLGGIYGPNREIVDRIRHFSSKEMESSGNEPTNHIHRDDIVSAIDFCIKNSLKGVFNLVNDSHPTRKALYSKLCSFKGVPGPIWGKVLKRGYKVSNQKIKERGFNFLCAEIEC